MKATIFRTIFAKNEPLQITIPKALQRIRDGKSRTTVESVRQGNKEDKLQLPAVLFSGEFSSRSDEDIHEHSGYIVLDFDHVQVESTKKALATDDYIYSCWVSPSGTGVKALVKVASPERHRDHFRALVRYFDDRYGLNLDESGINESRACFESWDPEIVIKETSESFNLLLSEEGAKAEPEGPTANHTDYNKLNIAARMVRSAPDGEKHNVLIKAATLCGGYIAAGRMEYDEVVRVLTREIERRDIDSLESAIADIKQGIEHGKTRPIRDAVQSEQEAILRMQIEDGDFSFLSEDDSDFAWIEAYSEGRIPRGLDTGSEELDKYFRYKKELVILNGHSNVGKTTVALYLMANAAVRHGWKWLVYSAENKTSSVKMQLMQMYMDKRVGSMTYAERKESFKWVQDNFYIINNDQVYSYLDIILFMEKVKHQYDIDAVFVDPYNSLRLDLRRSDMKHTHDYHYEAATAFLTFSTNRDVAVWLNMHAVTEAQRRKGNDGLPMAPYAEDTEGGGKFVNRADCFITIHRKVQAEDAHTRSMSEIHVRKVRETETGGRPTPLEEPYKIIMNTSHTGFVEWGTQTKLLKPYKLDGPEQGQITLDTLRFEIRPNEDFIRTLPSDEEAQGGDAT
jgi:replicative DNA helicase